MLTQFSERRDLASKSKNHGQDRSEDAPDSRAACSVCTSSQVFTDFFFAASARRYLSDKLFLKCPTSARGAEWSLVSGSSHSILAGLGDPGTGTPGQEF